MDLVALFFPGGGLDYALLLMLRVSALILSSPVFGRSNIPNTARIAFCIMLTALFYAALPPSIPAYATMLEFAFLCLKELMIGIILGWVTTLFFQLPFVAGVIIDMQIGFGMVNILDPASNLQVPVTGNILNIVLLMCFFLTDGHHRLIDIVYTSVQRVPIGGIAIAGEQLAMTAVQLFSQAFVLAIQVAMPVIAASMLMEVAQGVMIRTVPQLNMYVVGLPVKVFGGLFMLAIILEPYIGLTSDIYNAMFAGMNGMFEGLVPLP